MDKDYSKMTEQEALEILQKEWPEYNATTQGFIEEGKSLVEWLSILESFG